MARLWRRCLGICRSQPQDWKNFYNKYWSKKNQMISLNDMSDPKCWEFPNFVSQIKYLDSSRTNSMTRNMINNKNNVHLTHHKLSAQNYQLRFLISPGISISRRTQKQKLAKESQRAGAQVLIRLEQSHKNNVNSIETICDFT